MSEDNRRAVRPKWICETGENGVEDEWEEYAKKLKAAVKARAEEPEAEEEEELGLE